MKNGVTLLCNIYGACKAFLTDQAYVKEALITVPGYVGLTPVEHTFTCYFFPASNGDYGLSAQMILLESHIYLHTWPETGYARLELSSCKQFDHAKAIEALTLFSRGRIGFEVIGWDNIDNGRGETMYNGGEK